MPYKAYWMGADGQLRRNLEERQIQEAFQSKQGLLWVDIYDTTPADGEFLARVFTFHHLAIEDCVSPEIHPPKVDVFSDHLFIVAQGVSYSQQSDIVETTELALFLGSHFVVSNHNFPLVAVDAVARRVEDDGRPMKQGADMLAHALIDAIVDNVLPAIDRMSEETDLIEEQAILQPQESTLRAILNLKRSALRLHRILAPQREVLNRLSRREFPLIREEALFFYRDVYDHLVRLEDFNQGLRERTESAITIYLSSIANRQNETMKVISIFAAIFLPLALVASIYGMNFENMPELKWRWGYFAVLGVMGTVALAAIGWLWARRLITWGRKLSTVAKPLALKREDLQAHQERLLERRKRR
ncbi:MAG: magnesium/cobalt transporter CorA [Chloroflexi bacterium]|nr:magnesium/cobalt transporter CorA [Chloroflexota bacterium]